MNKKEHDFYQKLRKQIREYLEKHDFQYGDILLLAPDFFHLLVKLTMDERIPPSKKVKFFAAIAYFLSPLDFFPEALLGPIGYMDDIAIAAWVLNEYINKNDIELVHEHWAGEGDVLASIQNIITVANEFLGEGLWNRIKRKIEHKDQEAR
jgi:uncharacterized membrane protein YkvA (DUF1232 family)